MAFPAIAALAANPAVLAAGMGLATAVLNSKGGSEGGGETSDAPPAAPAVPAGELGELTRAIEGTGK